MDLKIDNRLKDATRTYVHTSEEECIRYVEYYINSYPEGFTKEKLINAIKKNTKRKKFIYIGTNVRNEGLLGDCAHFYDARPDAMSWTNDN